MTNSKTIKNPRITEKASFLAEQNVYTFNVANSATKSEIVKAIFALYKVKPVKVNVATITKKVVMTRQGKGSKGGGKKAIVYLKKGDKIELV